MRTQSSNRIHRCFNALARDGKKAFIPYITAGDPEIAVTERMVLELEKAGCDIIELGIPFSDPLADGKTIQDAITRALDSGTTPVKVFDMVRRLRKKTEVPIVFMTYYNIVLQRGLGKFVANVSSCGADGLIVPDLPAEESEPLARACRKEGVSLIMLAAPTTSESRFKTISELSGGFIYYVSLAGVTGQRQALSKQLKERLKKLKQLTEKPLCVGFGISSPEHVSEVSRYADGAIVGSALVKMIESATTRKKMYADVSGLAKKMAEAAHKAGRPG